MYTWQGTAYDLSYNLPCTLTRTRAFFSESHFLAPSTITITSAPDIKSWWLWKIAGQECGWETRVASDSPSTTNSVVTNVPSAATGVSTAPGMPTVPPSTSWTSGQPSIAPGSKAVGGTEPSTVGPESWSQSRASTSSMTTWTSMSTGSSSSGTSRVSTSHYVSTPLRRPDTAAIVGGVIGGLVALSLLGGALWYWRRARRLKAALAPSVEFMKGASHPLPGPAVPQPTRDILHQCESEGPPSPFTAGSYSDLEEIRDRKQCLQTAEGSGSEDAMGELENVSAAAVSAAYSHSDLDQIGEAF